MKRITELTNKQAKTLHEALGAIPQLQPAAAWVDSYEDFLAYVADMGLTLDRVPRWPSGTAVFVAAHPARGIYLKRLKRREIERYQDLNAAGMSELGMVAGDDLAGFIHLEIVDIDQAQAQRGRRKWGKGRRK